MKPKDSLYYHDWFTKVDKDIERVERLIDIDDLEGARFHLQQAMEKYLKG